MFLIRWQAVLVLMLIKGVDTFRTGTNATSGVVPEPSWQLFDLTTGGHLRMKKKPQFRLLELFDTMLYSADFSERFREAIKFSNWTLSR